jgi:DNA helicase TIP49 (TBP-interacting protein)
MVQISEVKGIPSKYPILTAGTARENRVAAHSHIKGLGLRDDGLADPTAGGFIGQTQAREVSLLCPPLAFIQGIRTDDRPVVWLST